MGDKEISEELLREQYVVEQKSAAEIAQEYGSTKTTILTRLKKYGIPVRGCSRSGRPNNFLYGRKIVSGEKFGQLTATEKKDEFHWLCLCECGNEIVVKSRDLKKNRIKTCGCYRAAPHVGHEGVSGNLFGRYKQGAKTREIEFDITSKDMWDLFVRQKGVCAISGVAITLDPKNRNCSSASLDRIDSKKGYTTDNIQWVHKMVNTMKWDIPIDQFVEWCVVIANNKKRIHS